MKTLLLLTLCAVSQVASRGHLVIRMKSAHPQKATVVLSDGVDPFYLVLPVILPKDQQMTFGNFIVDFDREYTVSIRLNEAPQLGLNSSVYSGELTPLRGAVSPLKVNLPLTGLRFDFECEKDFQGDKCNESCASNCTSAPATIRDLQLKVDYSVNPQKLETIVDMLKKENEIDNSFTANQTSNLVEGSGQESEGSGELLKD